MLSPLFSSGRIGSSFSPSTCWNRYIHMLLHTCAPLSSVTQHCPFPFSCHNNGALFSMSSCGRQSTMNHWWHFCSHGSSSWELISCFCFCPLIGVYAEQSVSYNLFVFQPLLSTISTPLPPLFVCIWSQKLVENEAITTSGSEDIKR